MPAGKKLPWLISNIFREVSWNYKENRRKIALKIADVHFEIRTPYLMNKASINLLKVR